MDASSNHCIFTMSRATARIAAYLKCRRARGDIIHAKNAVILCRVTSAGSRERRRSRSLKSCLIHHPPPSPRKSFENQRGPPRWPPARITTFLQCPVTTSMRGEKLSKQNFQLKSLFEKQFSNSRSIDGSNPCILRVDRDCVERIHREYAVAMGYAEIGKRWARQRGSIFGRRGPWERPLAQSRGTKQHRPGPELEI